MSLMIQSYTKVKTDFNLKNVLGLLNIYYIETTVCFCPLKNRFQVWTAVRLVFKRLYRIG